MNNLDYSLSDSEMRQLCPTSNFILYSDLHTYDNIDDILSDTGKCIILYLTSERSGHYVCVFKRTDKILSYFNSYGFEPDDELFIKPISKEEMIEFNEDKPELFRLMHDSPYRLEYNDHKLQSRKPDVNTCGKHVCVRLHNTQYDPDTYAKRLRRLGNPDEVVTELVTGMERSHR